MAPHSASQDTLDAYTAKILPILQAGGAEATFRRQEQQASSKLDQSGFNALIPAYEAFAEAIRRSDGELKKVKPPAAAEDVHKAWIAYFSALAENLEGTTRAMRAGHVKEAADLAGARRPLMARMLRGIGLAITKDGFDESYFGKTGRLTYAAN